MHTFGIGAIVDLPNVSALIMGLDDWELARCARINEERLLGAVRQLLGAQVDRLISPPMADEDEAAVFRPGLDETATIGVPVAPFPRYLRCPRCDYLGPVDSGVFRFKSDPYRADRARFVHENCSDQKVPPTALPARFLVACAHGHLDDFPWSYFVHRGATDCTRPRLKMRELGISGEARDIEVRCTACDVNSRRLADAFDDDRSSSLGLCRGRRPHLRDFEEGGCSAELTTILLGASNSWFPVQLTALSVPRSDDALDQLVEKYWGVLKDADVPNVVSFLRKQGELRAFEKFSDDQIWRAIVARRDADQLLAKTQRATDLKGPEWEVFSKPDPARNGDDFRLVAARAPKPYSSFIDEVVLGERLRQVSALIGFTRIHSPGESVYGDDPEEQLAPLARKTPTIVPASEVRGEGIFIRFKEPAVSAWCREVEAHEADFREAHIRYRRARDITPPEGGFPGIRFVLLHSFAHALMRQLALECGYTAASIRERIYASEPGEAGGPMAGVLLYTAAPDSEGTLGGLVGLGRPEILERHLDQALEQMRLCSSDPLCSEHHPYRDGVTLHGAACHACLFAPETSCEAGNRYLDRAALVGLLRAAATPFFNG